MTANERYTVSCINGLLLTACLFGYVGERIKRKRGQRGIQERKSVGRALVTFRGARTELKLRKQLKYVRCPNKKLDSAVETSCPRAAGVGFCRHHNKDGKCDDTACRDEKLWMMPSLSIFMPINHEASSKLWQSLHSSLSS